MPEGQRARGDEAPKESAPGRSEVTHSRSWERRTLFMMLPGVLVWISHLSLHISFSLKLIVMQPKVV